MPDNLDLIEILEKQLSEVARLFKRIGKAEKAADQRKLLNDIVEKLTTRRIVKVLLKDYGALCEQCLAYSARIRLSQVAAILVGIGDVAAMRAEPGECSRCQKFRNRAVNRSEPDEMYERSDPLCPVCSKAIEAKHSVTIDHGDVVHAECWGKPPVKRSMPVRPV